MPYCPRCGVEAAPAVRHCPLCRTAIPEFADLEPGEATWPGRGEPGDPAKVYATGPELRSRAFLTIAAVLVVAAVAVAITDLSIAGGVTWSRWPLFSLAAVLGLTAAVFVWHRQPDRWAAAWVAIVAVFLLALDLGDQGLDWAPTLGLPILATTSCLTALGLVVVRRSRRGGYDLFAWTSGLIAVELVALDLLVRLWSGLPVVLGWSLVTTLVFVPLTLLFLLLHLTLQRSPDLGRIFHF